MLKSEKHIRRDLKSIDTGIYFEALEPRLLFSGTPEGVAVDAISADADQSTQPVVEAENFTYPELEETSAFDSLSVIDPLGSAESDASDTMAEPTVSEDDPAGIDTDLPSADPDSLLNIPTDTTAAEAIAPEDAVVTDNALFDNMPAGTADAVYGIADDSLSAETAPDGTLLGDTLLAQADDAADPTGTAIFPTLLTDDATVAAAPKELVFINDDIWDHDQLTEDLTTQNTDGRDITVVTLDSAQDGIEQISSVLAESEDIDAIHFVSHGTDRSVKLGDTWIDNSNIEDHAPDISGWGDALTGEADLLFYGCNLAGGDAGRALLEVFKDLTDADVAASTDDTGHALLGGDWDFEYQVGPIDTAVAFSIDVQQNWLYTLPGITPTLWMSTLNDVTGGGSPGIDTWEDGEAIELGDPNLTLGTATDGTFSSILDLDDFAASDARLNAIHYVTNDITVGSATSIDLLAGDVLLSTTDDETIGGTAFNDEDVFVFRPDTFGDHSSGTFFMLIDGSDIGLGDAGEQLNGVTLIEQDTVVAGTTFDAGTFLLSSTSGFADIRHYDLTSVGTTTAGSNSTFLDLSDIDINDNSVDGLDLVETDMDIGGVSLTSGQLLVYSFDDADAGDNALAKTNYDIFVLDITSTGTTSAATATMFFDGSDVSFNTAAEELTALSLVQATNDAPVVGAPGAPLAATEQVGLAIHGTGFTVSDADEGGAGATATLNVTEGTITVVEGDSGVTITGGNGTDTVTLSGTIAEIDDLLTAAGTGTITYLNSSDTPGATATFTTTVNDAGNTGVDPGLSGGVADEEGTNNVTINITAVNDAPAVGAPGAPLAATEQVGLAIHGTGFTVSDADEGGAGATATLNVTEGTITVAEGDSGVTITGGNGTATVTLSGTIAEIDDLLTAAGTGTITYLNNSDTPGATATFTTTVNDAGNTGADPGLSGGVADEQGTNNVTINITAVNDKPTVTPTVADLAYTEGDGAEILDSGITVADVDNANLKGAVIQITGNYQNGEDTLSFVNQNGITGVWNAGNGTLTLSGTTTKANYQTALQSITYTNGSEDPDTNTRTVTFTATDEGNLASDAGTRDITVAADNDKPTVTPTVADLAYTENDGAVILDDAITVADVDNANIKGAVIQITGNYQNGEDTLSFTNKLGITGTWTAATGTLELTGTTTKANYQTALQSITYTNGSADPDTNPRTVTFTVTDEGNLAGDGATRDITVAELSDKPVVTPTVADLAYTENDGAVTIDDAITVTDVDNANIKGAVIQITGNYQNGEDTLAFVDQNGITGVWDAGTGKLTLSGTTTKANYQTALQSITYTNDSEDPDTGDRTVTFTVTDESNLDSDAGTRDITVASVNDIPVADDAVFTVAEDAAGGTVVGTATATDLDINDTQTFSITAGNSDGIFAIDSATGQITIADNTKLDFETAESHNLTVTVTDDGVGPLTDTAAITVNVTNVNEIPVADDAAVSVDENSANGTVVGTVAAIDPDAGDTLTYSITAGNSDGIFAIDSATGQITVADNAKLDYESAESHSLTIQVKDTGDLTDTFTTTVSVTGVNEEPLLTDYAFNIDENTGSGIRLGTISASDPDMGDALIYSIIAGNENSAFRMNAATGEISINNSEALDFETRSRFDLTVRVTDSGALTQTASVTVTLNDVKEKVFWETEPVSPEPGPEPANAAGTDAPDGSDSGENSGKDETGNDGSDGQTDISGSVDDRSVGEETQTPESEDAFGDVTRAETAGSLSGVPDFLKLYALDTTSDRTDRESGGDNNGGQGGKKALKGGAEAGGNEKQTPAVNALASGQGALGSGLKDADRMSAQAKKMLSNRNIQTQLDALKEQINNKVNLQKGEVKFMVGTAGGVTATAVAGYMLWMFRGVSLIASAIASLPVWQFFDPLPVLSRWEKTSPTDGKPGEDIASEDEKQLDDIFKKEQTSKKDKKKKRKGKR